MPLEIVAKAKPQQQPHAPKIYYGKAKLILFRRQPERMRLDFMVESVISQKGDQRAQEWIVFAVIAIDVHLGEKS